MPKTTAQALAERIRYQATAGEKVLQAAGAGTEKDHTTAVFGAPEDVLNVCGNVSDVAHTNHLWYLDAVASGAIQGDLPTALRRTRPASIAEAVEFLSPRETDTAEQALLQLRTVNEQIASGVERLTDDQLDAPVEAAFYGALPLRDLLFAIIEHGSLHIGQAWGILKGHGLTG
jgi:uncharacterized damage-inducible protein DinB